MKGTVLLLRYIFSKSSSTSKLCEVVHMLLRIHLYLVSVHTDAVRLIESHGNISTAFFSLSKV